VVWKFQVFATLIGNNLNIVILLLKDIILFLSNKKEFILPKRGKSFCLLKIGEFASFYREKKDIESWWNQNILFNLYNNT
jgi:hypothetical protein